MTGSIPKTHSSDASQTPYGEQPGSDGHRFEHSHLSRPVVAMPGLPRGPYSGVARLPLPECLEWLGLNLITWVPSTLTENLNDEPHNEIVNALTAGGRQGKITKSSDGWAIHRWVAAPDDAHSKGNRMVTTYITASPTGQNQVRSISVRFGRGFELTAPAPSPEVTSLMSIEDHLEAMRDQV